MPDSAASAPGRDSAARYGGENNRGGDPGTVKEGVRRALETLRVGMRGEVLEAQLALLKQLVPSQGMRYHLPSNWKTVYIKKPTRFYKVVTAVQDLRIVSVFDGKTQYRLGHTTRAARGAMSWPPTDAVLYCYQSAERALNAQFPKKVAVEKGPLFLMKCKGWGRCFVDEERGIWAVECLRPEGFVISNGSLEGINTEEVERE